MKVNRLSISAILLGVFLLASVQSVFAGNEELIGLWQYEEISTEDATPVEAADGESELGVLLSDLETMPLHLLSQVFGKLSYTAAFSDDHRFEIHIAVLGMCFDAQGEWSTQDGRMTLNYDGITGFEKLWWLGGFDHLTHCDPKHRLTETVDYTVLDNRLTFSSAGANLVFAQ